MFIHRSRLWSRLSEKDIIFLIWPLWVLNHLILLGLNKIIRDKDCKKKKYYILGRGRFPLYVTSFHAKIGVTLPWIKVEENNYRRPCLRSLPRHCLVTQRFSRWGETTVYTDPNKFVNGRISAQISQQIAAMLAVQKFARFPGFHVNESRIFASFCLFKILCGPGNATGPQGVCFLF